MRDFTKEEDIRESEGMSKEKGRIIRIDTDERVPVYLMSSHYHDGFAHWVTLPNGNTHRVACGGGEKGEGNDPDNCPICAFCAEQFAEAKRLRASGRKAESEELWQQTRKMAGSYELYFVAARGEINVTKIEGGKKKLAVEFDNPRVGLLRLTRKQRDDLKATVNESEHLTSFKDLFNRWIVIDKRVRGKDDYASLDFIPAPKPTARPKAEVDEEALEINKLFDIDKEELKNVLNLLVNGGDEEVELENEEEQEGEEEAVIEEDAEGEDEGAEEEVSGEQEEEEADSVEVEEEASITESEESSEVGMDFLDDVDDDFEDDLPYEEKEKVEEKPALPKAAAGKKPTPAKTSPAKAAASPKVQSKSSAKREVIQRQSATGQKPKATSSSPAKTKPTTASKVHGSKASSPKASSSRKPPKRTDL